MRDNEINIKWIYTIKYLHYMFSKGHTQVDCILRINDLYNVQIVT